MLHCPLWTKFFSQAFQIISCGISNGVNLNENPKVMKGLIIFNEIQPHQKNDDGRTEKALHLHAKQIQYGRFEIRNLHLQWEIMQSPIA